jgi:hypothetical protein
MMYPDPWTSNPFEPPKPPDNFLKWYLLGLLAITLLGMVFLGGCKRPGEDISNAILNHCADTAYLKAYEPRKVFSKTMYEKCVNDSVFVLDQLEN